MRDALGPGGVLRIDKSLAAKMAYAAIINLGGGFVLSQTIRYGDFETTWPTRLDFYWSGLCGICLFVLTVALAVTSDIMSRRRVVERHDRYDNRETGCVVLNYDTDTRES